MSDDLQISDYGRTSIERSQGFEPMPPAPRELEQAVQEKTAFDRGVERLSQIDQAGERLPDEIGYKTADGSPYPEKYSVEADRAAADVSQWREGLRETEQTLKDIELAAEIERLKTAEAQTQPQQQPAEPVALDQQQQEPLPPPQLPPELQSEANNELIAAFQREPKILEAVNTLSWQTDQKIAAQAKQALEYTQAVEQQYAQYTQANANIALAAMFSNWPELRGMTIEQINAATPIIERTNPERGAQIRAHVAQVSQLANEAKQVQAAQMHQQYQRQQQQFQGWAQQQDDAWEQSIKNEPPARQAAIRDGATRMLKELGMSQDRISHLWNTNDAFRSKEGQTILTWATNWYLQQQTAKTIRPAPVPPVRVQVPGPTGQRATEEDYDLRDLSNKLNSSHSAKDAARLLSARRARSR